MWVRYVNQTKACTYEYLHEYTNEQSEDVSATELLAHQALRRHRRPDDAVVGLVERIHKLVDLLGPIDVRPEHVQTGGDSHRHTLHTHTHAGASHIHEFKHNHD